jgi:phage anti-repressor protein
MNELRLLENELVPVYVTSTGEKVVYGSELHEVLKVKSNYRDWIRNRLSECEAVENEDYEAAKILAPSGQTMKEHIIKLDTAKEMAMLERNEQGKRVRRYFIRIEKKYKEEKRSGPTCIEDVLIQSLQEMKDIRARVDKQSEAIHTVKEAMTAPAIEEPFSTWVARTIERIANSPDFNENSFRYQTVWGESYKRLTDKAGCRLDVLKKNAQKRAEENGVCKSKVKAISKLSVIESDKRLKALYITVLQEMTVAYCVEDEKNESNTDNVFPGSDAGSWWD